MNDPCPFSREDSSRENAFSSTIYFTLPCPPRSSNLSAYIFWKSGHNSCSKNYPIPFCRQASLISLPFDILTIRFSVPRGGKKIDQQDWIYRNRTVNKIDRRSVGEIRP